jgi:hypothetical protein
VGGSGGEAPQGQRNILPGSKVKKNISHKNIEISIFTLKEGPMVDDRVLPGSKEHQLPGSKVKGQKKEGVGLKVVSGKGLKVKGQRLKVKGQKKRVDKVDQ